MSTGNSGISGLIWGEGPMTSPFDSSIMDSVVVVGEPVGLGWGGAVGPVGPDGPFGPGMAPEFPVPINGIEIEYEIHTNLVKWDVGMHHITVYKNYNSV